MNVKSEVAALPPVPQQGNIPSYEPARQKALNARLGLIGRMKGEDLPVSVWEAPEVATLLAETQELQDRGPATSGLATVGIHRGGHGKSTPQGDRRWKSGHWGDPVVKEVGAKALLSGSVTVPSLSGGIVPLAPGDRATSLLDVVPSEILRGTDTYGYLLETARTNNAAEVAASALKPTSVYTVSLVTDKVRVIAHLSQPINRFDLEDTEILRGYIDGSLRNGVLLRLDSQILSGNGTAPSLRGLANTVGIQTQAFSSNILTTARKALTKLQINAERQTGVYVMNPTMWEGIELLQEADGSYLFHSEGGPVDLLRQRLWGQPVVVTNALAGANAYLFDPADTHLWERDQVRVDWSEAPVGSVADHAAFESNEIVFRAEGRFGFAVQRPASVVQFATA